MYGLLYGILTHDKLTVLISLFIVFPSYPYKSHIISFMFLFVESKIEIQCSDLKIEVDNCKTRAEAAQHQAAVAIASKDTTVHDLTRGMVNYKYLGLDFQKADHDRLKYVQKILFFLDSTVRCSFPFLTLVPPPSDADFHLLNWTQSIQIKNIPFVWERPQQLVKIGQSLIVHRFNLVKRHCKY